MYVLNVYPFKNNDNLISNFAGSQFMDIEKRNAYNGTRDVAKKEYLEQNI